MDLLQQLSDLAKVRQECDGWEVKLTIHSVSPRTSEQEPAISIFMHSIFGRTVTINYSRESVAATIEAAIREAKKVEEEWHQQRKNTTKTVAALPSEDAVLPSVKKKTR